MKDLQISIPREVLLHEEQAANSALHYDAENQPAYMMIPQ